MIRRISQKLLPKNISGQLQLPIQRPRELDRNYHKGGRSFYFFDFDDNIAVLGTNTYIFHKDTKQELALSSAEYTKVASQIGESGLYKDYFIDLCEERGSFRNFRDRDHTLVEKILGRKQIFEKDFQYALGLPDIHWKGPAWDCFFHAVYNQRPTALITARGHHPDTLKRGIRKLVRRGHLPSEPNYLEIYPVSHPETIESLGFEKEVPHVAQLKRAAIRAAVTKAFDEFGYNPHHRFGMSDDDPKNIELITLELIELKKDFPDNSFFMIETHDGKLFKKEIFKDHTEELELDRSEQMKLFQADTRSVT